MALNSLEARPGLSMALTNRWEPGMSMAHGTYHSVVARSVHGTDPTSPPPAWLHTPALSLESFATVSLSSGTREPSKHSCGSRRRILVIVAPPASSVTVI